MNAVPESVTTLFPTVAPCHFWLVGGAVRDQLLGLDRDDCDVVAMVSPEELIAAGFRSVVSRSGQTVWIRAVSDVGQVEITTIESPADLHAELSRRDLTIHAMAVCSDGTLIDPFNGACDCHDRCIRVVHERSFYDDPVRVLRALRLCAHGFSLEQGTRRQLEEVEWDRALSDLPIERLSREFLKALAAPYPERFLKEMLDCSLGREFLPEWFVMQGIPAGPPEKHPEGSLANHVLLVLEQLATLTDDPLARFCAFGHDLGKCCTDPVSYPRHIGHDLAGVALARVLCDRLKLPVTYREALMGVCRWHTLMNRWDELRDETRLKVAYAAKRGGFYHLLPLVSQADTGCQVDARSWEAAGRAVSASAGMLGVREEQLMACPPDKRGGLLMKARTAWFRDYLHGGSD